MMWNMGMASATFVLGMYRLQAQTLPNAGPLIYQSTNSQFPNPKWM